MSKFIRLNNANHYHDSGSKSNFNMSKSHLTLRPPFNNNKNNIINNNREEFSATFTNLLIGRRTSYRNSKIGSTTKSLNNNKNRTTMKKCQNFKLAFIAIASLTFVLLTYINQVHSLNCYSCSSADNPGCDEAFTGRANFTDTDCEKHIGRPAKVCRKLIQYIEHKKVVIRSCGYIDEHEEKDRKPMCYKRSGTFALMMESCICYEDNCNHSASLVPNQSVLLLLSGFSLMFYIVNHCTPSKR